MSFCPWLVPASDRCEQQSYKRMDCEDTDGMLAAAGSTHHEEPC